MPEHRQKDPAGKRGPSKPDCPDCLGSGWGGDNGPGIQGNTEYAPCDCTRINRRC